MSDSTSASVSASSGGKPSTGFQLRDLLSFEKMIVPKLITLAYYVLSVLAVLAGVVLIFIGASSRLGGGLQVFSGFFTLVFGPLMVRVACEQIIVLFGIYDRLGEIRDRDAT
jgi:hypothetical protein